MALKTTDLILPAVAQAQILTDAANVSAFQTAVRKIVIPGTGTIIHSVGKAEFAVVAEGAQKPVTDAVASSKLVRAHTFAGIVLVTNQLMKDATAVYDEILRQAPNGLATAFDAAVLGETGPFADFDNLSAVTEKEVDTYESLLVALKGAKKASHVVATRDFAWTLAGITAPNGAVVFDPSANTLFGLPITFTDAEGDFAVVGDFSKLVWGDVEGIEIAENSLGSVKKGGVDINLFDTNQTAIRIEARYGFRGDLSSFVKLVPVTLP